MIRSPLTVLFLLVSFIAASGCGQKAPLAPASPASSANPTIYISDGNNQTQARNTTLPTSLVVGVIGTNGALAANIQIDWTVVTGGGNFLSLYSFTNASGLASSILVLGPSAGANTVSATIHGTSLSVTFTETGT